MKSSRRKSRVRRQSPRRQVGAQLPIDTLTIPGLADSADELAAISVVIPTYNRCSTLLETLEVCRSFESGLELEFVVVDDGSTDATPVELEKLASEMPNLVWRRWASTARRQSSSPR